MPTKTKPKIWDEKTRDRLSEIIFGAFSSNFSDCLVNHFYVGAGDSWVRESNKAMKKQGWKPEWIPFGDCEIPGSRFATHNIHRSHKEKPGQVNITLARSMGGSGKIWAVSIPEETATKILILGHLPDLKT